VQTEETAAANLVYLQEHGLCESGVVIGVDGHFSFGESTITARGLDFLADDGGLSAILSTVVVKLHADSIRALLESKIEQANLPAPEKSALKARLAALSTKALETATTDLVHRGVDYLPNAIDWIRTLLGG